MSARLLNPPEVIAIAPLGEVTADGDGTGVDTSAFDGTMRFVFNAKNIAGTTPTLAGKLQHSDDDGGDDAYADITGGAFTGATDAAHALSTLDLDRNRVKKWVRFVDDIGGTSSPKFARYCDLLAFRKTPAVEA
jgi:hypothetical protein